MFRKHSQTLQSIKYKQTGSSAEYFLNISSDRTKMTILARPSHASLVLLALLMKKIAIFTEEF